MPHITSMTDSEACNVPTTKTLSNKCSQKTKLQSSILNSTSMLSQETPMELEPQLTNDRTIRKGRQPSIIFRCIPFIFCLTPNANRLNRNTKTAFITSLEYRASAGGVYAILKSELGGRVLKLNKYLPASIRVGRLGGSKVYRPVDASEIYGLEFTDLLSFISKGLDSLYEAGLLNAETTTEVISTIDNLEIFVNEIIGYGGFNYEDDIKLMEFEYLSGKLLNMLGSKREVVWLVNQEVRRVREQFLTKFPEADVGWEVARL